MRSIANEIWRTYSQSETNISEGAELIHNYIFSKKRSQGVSKYGKKDAEILTKFFRELKQISTQQQYNIGTGIKTQLLGQMVDNVPVINFALGGRSLGGVLFEKELQTKLFNNLIDNIEGEISGQATSTSYVKIDLNKIETMQKYIEQGVAEDADDIVEQLKNKLVSGKDLGISDAPPPDLYLKVGAKRFGKIDMVANSSAEIAFTAEGEAKGNLKKAMQLLKDGTFSIKSYLTNAPIHLGNTSPKKAISAVVEYVATQGGFSKKDQTKIRGVSLFFLSHPVNSGKLEEQAARDRLYEHYAHMKQIYELTGIGLRYNNIDELRGVDFLLVNRAGDSSEITVYSTSELIGNLDTAGKFNIR